MACFCADGTEGIETAVLEGGCACGGGGTLIYAMLLKVVSVFAGLVCVLAVVGVIIAGYQYMTSGGDTVKMAKAKKRIVELVIGLVCFAFMWVGVEFLMPGIGHQPVDPTPPIVSDEDAPGGESIGGGTSASDDIDNPDNPGSTGSQGDETQDKKEVYKGTFTTKKEYGYTYVLNVPKNTPEGSPLFVFLHGDGEVGHVDKMKQIAYVTDARKYGETDGKEKFISIAPVNTARDWVNDDVQKSVINIINSVAEQYKVDKSRIYLMGFSRGAIGTWKFISSSYYKVFAAAIPISCPPPSGALNSQGLSNAAKVPIRAYSGDSGDDEKSYNSSMQSAVNKIKGRGGKAEKITLKGQSHSSITSYLSKKGIYFEIYDWALKQKR